MILRLTKSIPSLRANIQLKIEKISDEANKSFTFSSMGKWKVEV